MTVVLPLHSAKWPPSTVEGLRSAHAPGLQKIIAPTVLRMCSRLWMTCIETSSRHSFGYCPCKAYNTLVARDVSTPPHRDTAGTHVVDDILLAQVVYLRGGLNTRRPAAAHDEAEQPPTLFRRCRRQ